jgi:uncharacterized protein YkwD
MPSKLIAPLLATSLLTPAPALASTHHVRAHAASATACAGANAPASGAPAARLRSAVLCLINQQRRGRHLPALTESSRLDRSAQSWTNKMVSTKTFAHVAGASSPMSRITGVGYQWMALGENIATGFKTPAQVVRGWMTSPDHCHNILDPQYRNVGTGVNAHPVVGSASGAGTWTQDFGLKLGSSAPSRNWGPANRVCR